MAEAAMVKGCGPKTAFDTIHQCPLTFGHCGGWSTWTLLHQQLARCDGLEIGDGTAGRSSSWRASVWAAAVQYAKREQINERSPPRIVSRSGAVRVK